MPIYTFKKIKDPDNAFDTTDVIIRCETSSLIDLIEVFNEFLLACSYSGQVVKHENDEEE